MRKRKVIGVSGSVGNGEECQVGAVASANLAADGDEVVSVVDAAAEIGVCERMVRKYCKQGRLGKREGWHYRITRESLEAFKRQPRVVGNPLFNTPANPSYRRRKQPSP